MFVTMQRLFTVSYPEISAEASSFIRAFRARYDAPFRDVIEAHFTLLFGCTDVGFAEYSAHVAAVAASSEPISFSCQYAMLGADDKTSTAYVFLVPDQGHAAISLLHDRLYTGPLQPFLRLDIQYTPHITVGVLDRRAEAKKLCDELNREGVCVDGRLTLLTVGAIENGKFQSLSHHTMGAA